MGAPCTPTAASASHIQRQLEEDIANGIPYITAFGIARVINWEPGGMAEVELRKDGTRTWLPISAIVRAPELNLEGGEGNGAKMEPGGCR